MLHAPKNVPPEKLPAAMIEYARALVKDQFEYLLEEVARMLFLEYNGTDDDTPVHELPKIVTEDADESLDHHIAKLRLEGKELYSYDGRNRMQVLITEAFQNNSDLSWHENYAQGKLYIAGELLKMAGFEAEGDHACCWGTWCPEDG